MVWVQLLIVIITNLPGLLKSIKEIFELFGRDPKRAKMALEEIKTVQHRTDKKEQIRTIIEKYATR